MTIPKWQEQIMDLWMMPDSVPDGGKSGRLSLSEIEKMLEDREKAVTLVVFHSLAAYRKAIGDSPVQPCVRMGSGEYFVGPEILIDPDICRDPHKALTCNSEMAKEVKAYHQELAKRRAAAQPVA